MDKPEFVLRYIFIFKILAKWTCRSPGDAFRSMRRHIRGTWPSLGVLIKPGTSVAVIYMNMPINLFYVVVMMAAMRLQLLTDSLYWDDLHRSIKTGWMMCAVFKCKAVLADANTPPVWTVFEIIFKPHAFVKERAGAQLWCLLCSGMKNEARRKKRQSSLF